MLMFGQRRVYLLLTLVSQLIFSWLDRKCRQVTLAVRRMPHPHSAEHILEITETVLQEWNIQLDKLTHDGSNMVKAFRQQFNDQDEDTDDCSDDEDASEDEIGDVTLDRDYEDLDDTRSKYICKRSLFIQLELHKFNKDKSLKHLIKRVHSLVKKVNKSSKATECQRKLIGDCPTRWSSTFLMAERLVELNLPLTQVLDELGWDSLANSEWKMLERKYSEIIATFCAVHITG